MDVIWENHKCLHGKGVFFHDPVKSRFETDNIIWLRQNLETLMRHYGKKIRTPRLINTAIFAHIIFELWIRFA